MTFDELRTLKDKAQRQALGFYLAEGEHLVDGQSTSYPPCGAESLLWNWNTDGWWRKARTNKYLSAAPASAEWPGRYESFV